jgi:hypothetical protein
MLWVANFPIFVIFFFGIFAYFLLRMFAAGARSDTREIFEFYLTANEILRDDDRRWFGFEVNEAIKRGEEIVHRMSAAPPLVYFALGALQNKAGQHKAAVGNLAYIVENSSADESAYAYPTPELRNYVKVLRKIEREPADAPLTSAAVRALERARRIRAGILLEESRQKFANGQPVPEQRPELPAQQQLISVTHETNGNGSSEPREVSFQQSTSQADYDRTDMKKKSSRKPAKEPAEPYADRKSISEVLHDIYDKNVQ